MNKLFVALAAVVLCGGCFTRSVVVAERMPVIPLSPHPEVSLDGVDAENLTDAEKRLLNIAFRWAKQHHELEERVRIYNKYARERNNVYETQKDSIRER